MFSPLRRACFMFHKSYLHVTHVKQTTFFVTHIAASLIMELHQPATSINLSCHITSTPRLVLLQPSNLSRIFTTTHTLLKQSSIRNNPTTQLHTSDSPRSFCLCADNTISQPRRMSTQLTTLRGGNLQPLFVLNIITPGEYTQLSLVLWVILSCSLSVFFSSLVRTICSVLVCLIHDLCFSLCLSIYLFIIRLPLSVESRFGVRAYSPGELFSRVETTAWCGTLKIHLPTIPCPALL